MKGLMCSLYLIYLLNQSGLAQEISLIVTEYSGTNHFEKWVENGVPIPQSTAFEKNQLSLWKDGAEVEADFHPLAYWADGSIRWAKFTFIATSTSGYSIRTNVLNTTANDLFTAVKDGNIWTVATGAIRFKLNESKFNLFDEFRISSNSDGIYDKEFIISGTSIGPGNLNGTITLIEDGPISKRFLFKENYANNNVGICMWITAYKNSGKITLEYTIRNGKSTVAQLENGSLNLKLNLGGNVTTLTYGTSVTTDQVVTSNNISPQKRGAALLGGNSGSLFVLINRFSEMYPRSIRLSNDGNLDLTLTTGEIRPMTAHGVDIHLNFQPEILSENAFKEWADYYEFPYFVLPSYQFIQKTYAWDGMFIGDAGSVFPGIFGWDENYTFTPATAGYLNYGENRIQYAGNGHGLSDQMAGAFNRFLVTRDMNRFLQAEELAIVCMESRGIIMDDTEIHLDGTGYTEVAALFGTTNWDDPVEGRMWDSNHRGHYPITEFYYLSGKKRAANVFDNLTKSTKYIYLTDQATKYDMRPSGYYLSHFARNYSITKNEADREFLNNYWKFLHTKQHSVEGNNNWDPIHKNGFFASWSPYESDCGFSGEEVKLIFVSNWIQAAYDVFFLGAFENAIDHIYAAGKWLMEIYSSIGPNDFPGYCYRPWYQTTPSSVFSQDWWNAQDFPGLAIYYEFFGNREILDVLQRANEVYWEGGGLGFASVAAFALENQKPDSIPPTKITDIFFQQESGTGKILLKWKNVSDASRIQIKYTTEEGPIKDLHSYNDTTGIAYWEMQNITDEPTPLNEGVWQTIVLNLPDDANKYRFTMKSWDKYNNVSEISEIGVFTNVKQINDNKINKFRLEQNYPNPFNSETTIDYALPQPAEVTLKIYNMQGHEVRHLIQSTKFVGFHSVQWDARDNLGNLAASGIYFYRFEIISKTNGFSFVDVKKMILMK